MVILEDDYMMDQKPGDRFDSNLDITSLPLLDILESRHSGRIIRDPNKFIFLGESVFDEHYLDPSSYNDAIFDKDSEN